MAIKSEMLDELLKGADPKQLFEKNGLLDDLKQALAERMLNAELDHPLATERAPGEDTGGARNHRS